MIDLFTAQKLDQEDILANFKNYFENNSNEIYLDGNSLGKLPKKTLKILKISKLNLILQKISFLAWLKKQKNTLN